MTYDEAAQKARANYGFHSIEDPHSSSTSIAGAVRHYFQDVAEDQGHWDMFTEETEKYYAQALDKR